MARLNNEFRTQNSDILKIEDDVLSSSISSNSATHYLTKIEVLNDEFYTENSDVLEIEDNVLSSSNSAIHDLPKIEVKNDLAFIKINFSGLIQAITNLEDTKMTLVQSLEIMKNIISELQIYRVTKTINLIDVEENRLIDMRSKQGC
ncbi:hypothetical protein QTP88_023779 [Uroleucon formosanum]